MLISCLLCLLTLLHNGWFPLFLNNYLFIWLHQALAMVHWVFFFSCVMRTLSCGMWGPVPCPAIRSGSPTLRVWSLSCWPTREVPDFLFWVDYFVIVLIFTKGCFCSGSPSEPWVKKILHLFWPQLYHFPWRRQWQPTPVFLPGESQGRGSLVGCRLRGRIESDTTEVT